MLKYSAIEIWSKTPSGIKNKPCLELFIAQNKKMCYSDARNIVGILPILFVSVYQVQLNYIMLLLREQFQEVLLSSLT